MKSKFFKTIFIAIIAASISRPACAAFFRVDSDSGAALRPGDEFNLRVYLSPSEGESLMGAKCSLIVDPEFVEISPDRNDYAADPDFQKVEQFKTDPEKGMVTFKARSGSSLQNEKLFLVVPAKLKKEGSTFVNFTSSAMSADEKWAPSNNGYFKLFASESESANPLLFMTLGEENSILSSASLSNSYRLKTETGSATSTISFDMGLAESEKAAGVEDADIIIEFSKQSAKIGNGKFVRLDLMITKYPEYVPITGIDVNIKYDPTSLQYTNSLGQTASQVEVVRRLDDMPVGDLKRLANEYNIQYTSADFRGQPKTEAIQKSELIQLIRAYEGNRDESIFNFVFENEDAFDDGQSSAQDKMREVKSSLNSNFVDNQKGEIHLTLLVDFSLERKDIVFPQKVATLIFKGLRTGKDVPVEITSVLIDNNGGKLLVRGAKVTIDSKQEACDTSLPPALCKGSFKVTGDVSFDMTKKRTERPVPTKSGGYEKTIIEKYSLSETWNMHMNGSLRNGIRVKGHINKIPDRPQIVDLELLGNNSTAHFGEFSTTFKGTSLINPNITNISGMEFGYGVGRYKFTTLMGEGRSIRNSIRITGRDVHGPYSLTSGLIIPGSVQIINSEGTKIYRSDEYTVDYSDNTVTFTDIITTSETLVATFEQSSLLFSSGNVNGFGLSYDSRKNNPQKTRGIKIDSSFVTTMAPKGGLKYSSEATPEKLNMGQQTKVFCPEKLKEESIPGTEGCSLIFLKNRNIIKGTITITNNKGVTSFEDSPGVYILHRSLSMGFIVLKNSVFSQDLTIKYSYHDDASVINRRVVHYRFGDSSTQLSDIQWPYDALPGSEQIFLSTNDDYSISNDDIFVKYKFPEQDPWREESEDDRNVGGSSFSSLANIETGAKIEESISYRYETRIPGSSPSIIIFDSDVRTLIPSSGDIYVKMRYKTAPPDMLESSEFAKTGLGMDFSYKPSKNLSIDAQYGKTNSDLSTAYASDEETFVLDLMTNDAADNYPTSPGEKCKYVVDRDEKGNPKTPDKIVCDLRHKNIKDPVEVYVQFCSFTGHYSNSCPLIDKSGKPKTYLAESYDPNVYEFSSAINSNFIQLDKNNNQIVFIRQKYKDSADGDKIKDKFFYEDKNINHRFITVGDRITVRYLYAQTVDKLVQGDNAIIKTVYDNGDSLRLSFSKNIKDPYFDTSLTGRINDSSSGGVVDKTQFGIDRIKIGKWVANYGKETSVSQKLEAGMVSSTINTSLVKYGLSYSSPNGRFLKSISYSTTSSENVGNQGFGIKLENLYKNDQTTDYKLNFEPLKNVMSIATSYSVVSNTNKEYKPSDATSVIKNIEKNTKSIKTNYNPLSNLRTTLNLEETDSNNGDKSVGRNYTLNYTPFPNIAIDTVFNRTSASNSSTKGKFTEDNSYKFTISKYLIMSGINFEITQKREPRNNVTTYNSESDRKTAKFDLKMGKGLTLTPSFTVADITNTTLTNSDENQWALIYKPQKNSKNLSVSASLKNSDTTTSNISSTPSTSKPSHVVSKVRTIASSVSPTKTSTLDLRMDDTESVGSANSRTSFTINYKLTPSPNTSLGSIYTRSSEATKDSNDYRLDYFYNYNKKMRFNASYKKTIDNPASTTANTVTTSYDFNSIIALNESSELYLTYKQTIMDGPRAANTYLDVPNFSAKLKTTFR